MTDDAITYDDDYEDENDQTLPVFFLFFMVLVALVLLLGRALHNRPRLNAYLSEPALVLLVSAFVSFCVKIYFQGEEDSETEQQQQVQYDDYYAYDDGVEEEGDSMYNIDVDKNELERFLLSFSEEIFFMILLPPILFNSGYELKRELFFRHLRPIVSFAVIGPGKGESMGAADIWLSDHRDGYRQCARDPKCKTGQSAPLQPRFWRIRI